MVEYANITVNSPQLFTAIRAHLSAADLEFAHIQLDNAKYYMASPAKRAFALAAQYNAAMVFWIQDDGTACTVTFYLSNSRGGRLYTRVLKLDSNTPAGRTEVIAIAASSLFDKSIVEITESAAPSAPPPPPPAAPEPPKSKKMELFVGYAGTLFSKDTLSHGVQFRLGVLPHKHVALSLAYTQRFTLWWDLLTYDFSIAARDLDLFIGGRIPLPGCEFQLGVAWIVDFRNHATVSRDETIGAMPDEFGAIHSLAPRLTFTWFILEQLGLTMQVAGAVALNERNYAIMRLDGTTSSIVEPFPVKLVYQVGFTIRL